MTANAVLSSKALNRVIKAPSAVANTLDWRKASAGVANALAIDVHSDKIGLALATLRSEKDEEGLSESQQVLRSRQLLFRNPEPEQFSLGFRDSFSCKSLEPIHLEQMGRKRKRVISPEAKRRLSGLIRDHNVCGIVVSWPVQKDTGLKGASCGRTLWALEQLLQEEETEGAALPIAPNRPLCLWQGVHNTAEQEDAFGRCSVYARTSEKTEYFASKEQYCEEPVLASEVWRDFCEHHWPAAVVVTTSPGGVHNSTTISTSAMQINSSAAYSGSLISDRRVILDRCRSLVAA
eukprot:CAMPEP_0197262634 /NCGR_PEP_ID=MMETSP1432-20130617/602_1 /TAXON_ID=44447 /ORGANISM="Pseudo-nitzschia delicatissima, Strain UNC1205" /LENGTH=291 /DNA_ID=CAMNT_0042726941 /DNA_START=94 /DNA_END=969 /DNA_ORIENTATION=+